MITIKKIHYAGGACPYQIEAETDDGKYFYLRYRGGTLRFGVWENEDKFDISNYKFVKVIGDKYDGWPDNELISKELEGLVTFPDGFSHSFDAKGEEEDDPRDLTPSNDTITEMELRAAFGIDL